jgi:hypothetical protein
MDPLRHNCTQLYGHPYICKDTVGFKNDSDFHHFLPPFRFQQIYLSLSLNTVPEEKKLSDAGPLNHSIGLEEDRWKTKGIW